MVCQLTAKTPGRLKTTEYCPGVLARAFRMPVTSIPMFLRLLPKVSIIFKWLHVFVFSVYHCGSNDGWSDILFFTAIKEGSEWSPKFALFGDLGNDNPQSLARLQKETQLGMYDVILHIGKVQESFFRLSNPVYRVLNDLLVCT